MSASSELTLKVEWGDCDPAHIVFYPNYFRWFDQATQHLLLNLFGDLRQFYHQQQCLGFGLIDAQSSFHAPSRHGDAIVINSHVSACSSKVLQVEHRMTRDGLLLVEGVEKRFFTVVDSDDPNRIRAGIIPADVRAKLSGN